MRNKLKENTFRYRHRICLSFILCLFGVYGVVGQITQTPVAGDSLTRRKNRVTLIHADNSPADKINRPGVQPLIGDVQLKHEGMLMFCDSALLYEATNSVEAFSNVRMEQGDTLFLYGDYLHYDGLTMLAKVRENVKLINRNTTLFTDSLNYDRILDLGYYFDGGMLTDEENILTSYYGQYSPATKVSVFNLDVELVNPQFVLTSDTLRYNTNTKIATILGPSNIVSDNNHIYSERGFYDTTNEIAELLDRSVLTNQGKKLTGDSLYYDRQAGYGEAFWNVYMNDTINKSILTGDYTYYNELTEYAYATDRAVAIDYSQGDSLYIHGDTLKALTFNRNTDSLYREIRAYHKVRIYRTDVQGVCDSLVYNSQDSCMTMYRDPIIWNGRQQLLGEEIKIYMNDSTIDWAHIINQALTVEMKDSVHYNQVAGKEIKAFFVEGDMRRVEVIGDVRLVFYPEEKDSTMMGMNTSESSFMTLHLMQRQLQKIKMNPKTTGVLYPMNQIPPDKMRLQTFAWFDYIRPRDKDDIFEWRGKGAGNELIKTVPRPTTQPNRQLVNPR